MPKRIQRQRTKGWQMPKTAIYVGRPTKWGNPFDWEDYLLPFSWSTEKEARQIATDLFCDWLEGKIHLWESERDHLLAQLPELCGFDLICWCPPEQSCHADVLLQLANNTHGDC